MSTMKKRISMFLLALVMVVAMALPTFAASATISVCEDSVETDLASMDNFEPLSKDDYIASVAQYEGISYSQAAKKVEETRQDAIKKWGDPSAIAPYNFNTTSSENLGNGTTLFYGYVYFIDNQANGVYPIRYQCPASYVSTHYGRYFTSVTKSGLAYATGSGPWALEDSQCDVYTKQTNGQITAVTLSYSGVISTKYSVALSAGTAGSFFNVSGSVSTDYVCRKAVSGGNTHTLVQPT